MTIREAINKVTFFIFGDYDFYLSNLFFDEKLEEQEEMKKAWRVLDHNAISITDLKKHWDRINNIVPAPVRFVDRIPPRECKLGDLPF